MKYLIDKAWFIDRNVNAACIDGLGGNR